MNIHISQQKRVRRRSRQGGEDYPALNRQEWIKEEEEGDANRVLTVMMRCR